MLDFVFSLKRGNKKEQQIKLKTRKGEDERKKRDIHKGAPGVEPGTSRSAVECSTTELYPPWLYIMSNFRIKWKRMTLPFLGWRGGSWFLQFIYARVNKFSICGFGLYLNFEHNYKNYNCHNYKSFTVKPGQAFPSLTK